MPEKPPSFEEFKKQWDEKNATADRIRSLEGMVRKGNPQQRKDAKDALRKLQIRKEK